MTRILLVDDHDVVRDGIKKMFDARAEAVQFGEADQPSAALKLVEEQDWDIVVLDQVTNHSIRTTLAQLAIEIDAATRVSET